MPAETLEFKAELKQLLHLITHSLYSDREIFLRELTSNASDAINKVRFDALANADKLDGNTDWKIKLTPDAAAGTLTISDNGIGMSRAEVIDNLGTVAQSGTKAFLEAAKRAGKTGEAPGLIGQFGVGFYSAFMVADKVTVVTRAAGEATDATKWESDGQGAYTLEAAEKTTRGTDVILHLKDDAKDFLDSWKIRQLVRKFSDFLEHPVVMDVEKEIGEGEEAKKETVEETLNSRKAIWLRNKSEVKPEEYEGKKLVAADRGEAAGAGEVPAGDKEKFAPLLAALKEKLPDVSEVRLTNRLTESAACLVAGTFGMSAHMERLMERMGRDAGSAKRVLELNPNHATVEAVRKLHTINATDPRLDLYARLLYEQAVIAEGSKVSDPVAFAQRVNDLIARDAQTTGSA